MKHPLKILDCTLRDGGYYNNWDFDQELVEVYLKSMEKALRTAKSGAESNAIGVASVPAG